MPKKIMLKLKSDAKPHLYIDQIKAMMEGDTYLHPQMKNMLLVLKKSRMPFLRLATLKELIWYGEKFMHFERALSPDVTAFFKIDWSEEEKKQYIESPEKYLNYVLDNYKKLGYEISSMEDYGIEGCEQLIKSTEGKKK